MSKQAYYSKVFKPIYGGEVKDARMIIGGKIKSGGVTKLFHGMEVPCLIIEVTRKGRKEERSTTKKYVCLFMANEELSKPGFPEIAEVTLGVKKKKGILEIPKQ